ncbi:MAG: GNAT family N-acetyltransferase, partial [Gemmatimonadota bacterium]
MSETIIQLRASEFDEAMEFLNMVFGEHSPHDFARMLPTIYRPTDEHMTHNHAIRVDGRICAIVGMFPIAWQVGGARLRVAGIGGVSVRPDSRRLGYMRALMEHCVGRMKAEGCHVSWLGGQRQRYLYFGYDKCGSGYRFTLNKSNLRHSFIGRPKVRFEPLTTDQPERLARSKALHDAQPVHVERPLADFHRHLVCWYHVPYAAVDGDGDMVGYLVANAAGDTVTELLARDDGAALEMVHAWTVDHCQAGATFELHPWARRLAQLLGRYCESVSSTSTGNWQV